MNTTFHSPFNVPYNALIVEDEDLAQQLLQGYTRKTPWLVCAGVCDNALEAASVLRSQTIDVMFLDVRLPEMSGIDFLRTLHLPHSLAPAVVLTTAYSDYAVQGYELNVVDYLLKPFSFERYVQAANKAAAWLQASRRSMSEMQRFNEQNEQNEQRHHTNASTHALWAKDRREEIEVPHADILCIESFGNYVKIHTRARWFIAHQTLKHCEEILPSGEFCRIHKTLIVAKRAVERIDGNAIVLGTGQRLPIGITYKMQVLTSFKMPHTIPAIS